MDPKLKMAVLEQLIGLMDDHILSPLKAKKKPSVVAVEIDAASGDAPTGSDNETSDERPEGDDRDALKQLIDLYGQEDAKEAPSKQT